MRRLARVLAPLLACACAGGGAAGETLEPPPEAPAGDYVLERPDTTQDGVLEATLGASGSGSSLVRRGDTWRLRTAETSASWREGADPLSGGRLEAPLGAGRLRLGRLAPRWGCGLVLGAAAEPWSASAPDRGEHAPFAGRAGQGAWAASAGGALEAFAGRFSGTPLAGARARAGPCAAGALLSRSGRLASLACAAVGAQAELAMDARGRWRGEGAWDEAAGATRLAMRVRGGLAAFRSPAEPRRSGPAHALALTAERGGGRRTLRGHGAWWAFTSGASGARAALEVEQPLLQHAAVLFGFEERHGTQRDPDQAAPAASPASRQGFSAEWRGRSGGRVLTVRNEWWGAQAFARRGLGRELVARAGVPLPFRASLSVTHAAWSLASGESGWLAEPEWDRLTLRALAGVGRRSRMDLELPLANGRAGLGAAWTDGASRRRPPTWSVQWTRRTRL